MTAPNNHGIFGLIPLQYISLGLEGPQQGYKALFERRPAISVMRTCFPFPHRFVPRTVRTATFSGQSGLAGSHLIVERNFSRIERLAENSQRHGEGMHRKMVPDGLLSRIGSTQGNWWAWVDLNHRPRPY